MYINNIIVVLCILSVLFIETTTAVPAPSVGQKRSHDFHNERSADTMEKVTAQRELKVGKKGKSTSASSSSSMKSSKMGKSTSSTSPPTTTAPTTPPPTVPTPSTPTPPTPSTPAPTEMETAAPTVSLRFFRRVLRQARRIHHRFTGSQRNKPQQKPQQRFATTDGDTPRHTKNNANIM
eukprot:scaffold243_cov39-Attheya_sp.AAC.3